MSQSASLAADLTGAGVLVTIGPFLVRVRSDLPGVSEYLGRLYRDFPRSSGRGGHFDVTITGTGGLRRWWRPQANLFINGANPFLPLPAHLSGALFEWGLNWCVGYHANRWVSVHAAVVERNGRALILCGPSGSGKSTLCAALILDGWRLFSDEFALIDLDGDILAPLPRPISLKERAISIVSRRAPGAVFSAEGLDTEGRRFVHMRPPVESVRRAAEGARAVWLVLPRFAEGAHTVFEPLSKAQSLRTVTEQSFNHSLLGPRGFECLSRLVGRCHCYRLEYSNLDEAIDRLRPAALD